MKQIKYYNKALKSTKLEYTSQIHLLYRTISSADERTGNWFEFKSIRQMAAHDILYTFKYTYICKHRKIDIVHNYSRNYTNTTLNLA